MYTLGVWTLGSYDLSWGILMCILQVIAKMWGKHTPASCLPDPRDIPGFPPSILNKPYLQKAVENVII